MGKYERRLLPSSVSLIRTSKGVPLGIIEQQVWAREVLLHGNFQCRLNDEFQLSRYDRVRA
jgi:hypothetical protein